MALCAPAAWGATKLVDALNLTCQQFVALPDSDQQRTAAFLEGYSKRDVAEDSVGEVDIAPDIAIVTTECRAEPQASFWQKMKGHLPAVTSGERTSNVERVKPVDITCEEFLALDDSEQPEVVYWLDGYSRKGAYPLGEVDLGRDVGAIDELCKTSLEQSVWTRLESLF
jgi:HdeA/HdeB family protein